MTGPEPSHVVILTAPDGHRTLSRASLMPRDEAVLEAARWRRTEHPSGRGRWDADVREVR